VSRLIAAALAVYLIALSVALPNAQAQSSGQSIFRFDTFGSEQLWTDFLQMQNIIAESVSPRTALSVGLKVDVDALPPALIDALKASPPQVDLDDPAVTVQLLKLNAVVGVIGRVVGANNNLQTVGITCALCHSTVDDSFAPGIGHRLDGWANLTLKPGDIIALSPAISQTDKDTYRSWGPGKYDPRFRIFDGASPLPLNRPSIPVVIPSIFGLQGVGFETFNGDGPISYWNNYVAVTQMGGHGSFSDPRIGVSVIQTPDQVTPKLPALLQYQLSLQTPPAPPPDGSANRAAARRGEDLFMGAAGCANCHKPPLFTDVASGPDPSEPVLHDPSEIPTNPDYAARSATKKWRTTPLRALWQHPPYFHDGSAADLLDVVNRYNNDPRFALGLTDRQKADLVEFLKTL
jgi:mono/diheme cytochrome c family protein